MSDDGDLDRRIMDLADQFLSAFREVEQLVKRQVSPGNYQRFNVMLSRLPRKSPIAPYISKLEKLGHLRNSLSHEPSEGGRPIAAPLPATVVEIQSIRDLLRNPPTVGQFVAKQRVVTARLDQVIAEPLARMRTGDFSQAPVDGSNRLFTTNAVARWVADRLTEDDIVIGEHATVEAILTVAEAHEVAAFMPATSELSLAFEVLRRSVLGETVGPAAVLVTKTGESTDPTLGVIVQADLSAIAAKLHL